VVSGTASAWLREPDQFDSVSSFLRERGLLVAARAIMVVVAASAALIPISALAFAHHTTTASVLVSIFGSALCLGMASCWLTRWPTRRVSRHSVLLGAGLAAGWSLTQPSPALAALACTAMAVTGGYLAFFHNFGSVLLNGVSAAAIGIVAAVRLARDIDLASAVAAFWIMWLLNLAVPLGVRAVSKAMTHYAIRSDEDSLTGLLNRRAFGETVARRLIAEVRKSPTLHLVVMMIDLDDFKRVNDTHGHATGDRTLLRVAELLRAHMPDEAALCRAGSEEFLVAVTSTAHGAAELTTPLCDAVRTHCGDVTASIGVASVDGGKTRTTEPGELIDRLIDAADRAMYDAKRNGGDRMHLARHPRCA
jgi:diguanylate cyclase (GGDEF)-like protein